MSDNRREWEAFLAWHRRLCRRVLLGLAAGLVVGGLVAWRILP